MLFTISYNYCVSKAFNRRHVDWYWFQTAPLSVSKFRKMLQWLIAKKPCYIKLGTKFRLDINKNKALAMKERISWNVLAYSNFVGSVSIYLLSLTLKLKFHNFLIYHAQAKTILFNFIISMGKENQFLDFGVSS